MNNTLPITPPFRRVPSAYVVPPTLGADKFFLGRGFPLTTKPESADFIVLCGGADINPILYGEKPIPRTSFNSTRDQNELDIINEFKGIKPFVGICRGAQLLNVIAGGKLWQHVTNHMVEKHSIWEPRNNKTWRRIGAVNSVHHQMMRPGPGAEVVAVAFEADSYQAENESVRNLKGGDPEIVIYPELKFLCFQAHPEFGHAETSQIFMEYFTQFRQRFMPEFRNDPTV